MIVLMSLPRGTCHASLLLVALAYERFRLTPQNYFGVRSTPAALAKSWGSKRTGGSERGLPRLRTRGPRLRGDVWMRLAVFGCLARARDGGPLEKYTRAGARRQTERSRVAETLIRDCGSKGLGSVYGPATARRLSPEF